MVVILNYMTMLETFHKEDKKEQMLQRYDKILYSEHSLQEVVVEVVHTLHHNKDILILMVVLEEALQLLLTKQLSLQEIQKLLTKFMLEFNHNSQANLDNMVLVIQAVMLDNLTHSHQIIMVEAAAALVVLVLLQMDKVALLEMVV